MATASSTLYSECAQLINCERACWRHWQQPITVALATRFSSVDVKFPISVGDTTDAVVVV